jgi:hypothetical protein
MIVTVCSEIVSMKLGILAELENCPLSAKRNMVVPTFRDQEYDLPQCGIHIGSTSTT